MRTLEEVLVEQCAPTLARVKPASMFRYQPRDLKAEPLEQFSERICLREAFPHEIGALLGYPLADVIGFIRNGGRNCRGQGCWKSYSDPEGAKRSQEIYRKCTRIYTRLFAAGTPLTKLAVAA